MMTRTMAMNWARGSRSGLASCIVAVMGGAVVGRVGWIDGLMD